MTFKDWLQQEIPVHEIISDASGQFLTKLLGWKRNGSPPVVHPIGIMKRAARQLCVNSFRNLQNINSKLCYCNHTIRVGRGHLPTNQYYNYNFITFKGYSSTSQGNGKKKGSAIPLPEYFTDLGEHKFCISPSGNGEDCHRHYEALIMKSIPIIQEPSNDACIKKWGLPSCIKSKYEDLPVLYTKDYSELSVEYLQEQYQKILHTEYNFDKLNLSYWKYRSCILIVMCTNLRGTNNIDATLELNIP